MTRTTNAWCSLIPTLLEGTKKGQVSLFLNKQITRGAREQTGQRLCLSNHFLFVPSRIKYWLIMISSHVAH